MVRILSIKVGIIGAGPAGISAALYLKRSGINPIIFESKMIGGQLINIPEIENYLGYENISGFDLAFKMQNQIKDIEVKNMEIKNIFKENKKFIVTDNKEKYFFDYLIISTGQTKKKLENIKDIKGISYCALCDGFFYKNKDVAVVGGGNSALTEAIYLSNLCSKVYLIVRGKIKADYQLINRLNNKIEVLEETEVKKVNGDIFLKNVTLNNGKILKIDGLFISIGSTSNLDFIKNVNIDVKNSKILVDENMETSEKGIYACGDVIYKKYYQVISAINEGMVCALSISEKTLGEEEI